MNKDIQKKEISAVEAINGLFIKAKEYYGDGFSLDDGDIVGVFQNAIMTIGVENHQMKVDIVGDHPFVFEERIDCYGVSENDDESNYKKQE